MNNKSVFLSKSDVAGFSMGARLVGIRWDLIEWGLVFDMDTPISEAKGSPLYRVWIVFDGVSELCFPFEKTRLPNGCFITSSFVTTEMSEGFFSYSAYALLPTYTAKDKYVEPVAKTISITAKSMFGVRSALTAEAGSTSGWLSREDRNRLASEDEMLEAITDNGDALILPR